MNNSRYRAARWLAVVVALLCLTPLAARSSFTPEPPPRFALGDIPLDPETYQRHLRVLPTDQLEALPASYDARTDGIVTSAKDQGSCGSCWAFASVGAVESHLLKAFGVGPDDLSEQQQVSCNTDMLGCNGGSAAAIQYWEVKGPLYESCFPYTASDKTACAEDQCTQLTYRVVDYYTVSTTPTGFKTSLYNDGPSYWRFSVYQDFYDYWNYGSSEDVYVNQSSGLLGGHAVLLIGWDDTKCASSDNCGAYLCKNSWGETGGPMGDGTFWIAYSGHAHNLGFGMSNFSLVTEASDCGNGVCDQGEDCNSCPSDCMSGSSSGDGDCAVCFKGVCDGVCHPVKDGEGCPDCVLSWCCGDGVCEGEEDGGNCAIDCGVLPVCGNGTCDAGEDQCSCAADCGTPPVSEAGSCSDGIDNDCDGFIDCADSDCESDPACECLPKAAPCESDSECCSNKCRAGACR